MEMFLIIACAVFGGIIGSFLNVVLFRMSTGRTVGGRSMCLTCGKQLSVRELIPVLSYLVQRGRCAQCHAPISVQYPLVELLTAGLFVAAFLTTHGMFPFLAVLFSGVLLIVIGVYDLRHTVIPDSFVYVLIGFAAVTLFVESGGRVSAPELWDVLAGPLFALPFAALFFISRGKWMGFGDAKLALALGWLLGSGESMSAFLLSFWVGTVYVFSVMAGEWLVRVVSFRELSVGRKALTMKSEVPFAPFLICGAAIAFFFSLDGMELIQAISYFFL